MVTQIIIRYVDDNYSIRREQFETFGKIIKYLSNTQCIRNISHKLHSKSAKRTLYIIFLFNILVINKLYQSFTKKKNKK